MNNVIPISEAMPCNAVYNNDTLQIKHQLTYSEQESALLRALLKHRDIELRNICEAILRLSGEAMLHKRAETLLSRLELRGS